MRNHRSRPRSLTFCSATSCFIVTHFTLICKLINVCKKNQRRYRGCDIIVSMVRLPPELIAARGIVSLYAFKSIFSNASISQKAMYCGNSKCCRLVRYYDLRYIPYGDVYLCPHCRKANIIVKDFVVEHGGSIVYGSRP